jgi:hypothetical protein
VKKLRRGFLDKLIVQPLTEAQLDELVQIPR